MALTGMEGVVDAVRSELVSSLGARLTALVTEKGDDIALPDADEWVYSQQEFDQSGESVAGLVRINGSVQVGALNHGNQSLDGAYPVSIRIRFRDEEPEDRQKRGYRYVRALTEVIVQAGSLSGWIVVDPQLVMDAAENSDGAAQVVCGVDATYTLSESM